MSMPLAPSSKHANHASPENPALAGWSSPDLIAFLHAHRRALWLGVLLGLLGAVALFIFSPRLFRAESRLLLRYVADTTVFDPGAGTGRVLTPDVRGENIINSEIEIIRNRDTVAAVVDRIGPENFPGIKQDELIRERAITAVLRGLYIEVPRRSNMINLSYESESPELSLQVMRELVSNYLAKHLAVHRAGGAFDFLVQQTDQSRARLVETEEELRRLKAEAGVAMARESGIALLSRVGEIRRLLGEAEAQLAGAKARIRIMEGLPERAFRVAQGTSSTNALEESMRFGLQERLSVLRQREAELLKVFTPDSIPVQELRDQRDALFASIRAAAEEAAATSPATNQTVEVNAPAYLSIEAAELAGLQATASVLRDQLREALAESQRIDELRNRIDQLERTREMQEEQYRHFSRNMEQARINEALDAGKLSNISMVQPAQLSAINHRPRLSLNMAMASAGGPAVVLALLVLHQWFTGGTRIRRVHDLEKRVPLPALLDIPRAGRARSGANPFLPARRRATIRLHHRLEPYCDALVDRLMHQSGGRMLRPRLFGLAGCREGAGVSTLCAGLAASLARLQEGKVLLLRARDEACAGRNGNRHSLGMLASASGVEVRADARGNISGVEHHLLTAGPDDDEEGEGRSSDARASSFRWSRLLDQIHGDDYAFVVINLPPVNRSSQALAIGHKLHDFMLVVEADVDRLSTVRAASHLLHHNRIHLAGALLNKVSPRLPVWLRADA
jgi:uncharacterized protein involved in exopolysaccharide biosynthesis